MEFQYPVALTHRTMNSHMHKQAVGLAVLLALVHSAHAQHAHGLAAAQDLLSRLKVHPGLEVSVFAAEPHLVNPCNMDVDAAGRVWITEGANYRSSFQKWGKLRPGGDRIQVLIDSDRDGATDKTVTFYQGEEINAALGIAVLGDQVIVSRSPDIFVFEDRNHDLKADGPPRKLFTGIGGVDHDHGAHAFTFGPDGRLYFNVGNDGRQLKKADGSGWVVDKAGNETWGHRKPYQQGLVFRCNPDGSGVETLGWNFRNNYEVAVDSFGTLWQSDNDDDGNRGVRINFVMEFGNYGYRDEISGAGWGDKRTGWEEEVPLRHWHLNDPGVVPNLLQTGAGSPTGICVYEGNLLPEVFHGQMIHCDAGPRVVRAYPVQPDGAGYSARTVDLVSTEDNWFRPADVAVGPDGSVYIADWNDSGVGGHYMADQKLETMTGRVYRVAPKGHRPTAPTLDLTTARGAIEALKSPNLTARNMGWTALHAMGAKAEPELKKLWTDADPRFRARALHLLAQIPGRTEAWVDIALADRNPDLRITGLRIARAQGLDVIPRLRTLVNDADPQVRRECAIALRHHKSPEMPALWAKLATQYDGKDRWYTEALGIGADRNWEACLTAYLAARGGIWNTTSGREIVWRSRSKQTPALLVKILRDPSTTEKEKARFMRAFDFQSGPEKDAALLELLTASTQP
jgi:putative membrane-bound dehydrogenase-like protein